MSDRASWSDIEHGSTPAQAQRCYRLNPTGKACPECRAVLSAYTAEWRATRPIAAQQAKQQDRARERALWKLARLYPTMFKALVAEEASGLDERRWA